jgi:hypothetical protein
MRAAGMTGAGICIFFLLGAFLNIYQVVTGFLALGVVGEMSGLLLIKTIAIFCGPLGSIFGWVGLFS